MSVYMPFISAFLLEKPYAYGFLLKPPICFTSYAPKWHVESGTHITKGEYRGDQRGRVIGKPTPKKQDTFVTGASGTGRAFDVDGGSVAPDPNYVSPTTGKKALAFMDAGNGLTFGAKAVAATSLIEYAEVVIGRGSAPNASSRTEADNYCYYEVASGQKVNIRVVLASEERPRVELTIDTGATWKQVGVVPVGTTEEYLRGHDRRIRLRFEPDYVHNICYVDIGGYRCEVKPVLASGEYAPLPTIGLPWFYGKNGWAILEYLPLRHKELTVIHRPQDFGFPIPELGGARVTYGGLKELPADQVTSVVPKSDGNKLWFEATASRGDAGDGLGSAGPPELSDVTVELPGVWSQTVDGSLPFEVFGGYLPVMLCTESERLNEAARCVTATAQLTIQNHAGQYSNLLGDFALNLQTSTDNGGTMSQRMAGVTTSFAEEGMAYYRSDPDRILTLPLGDKSNMLQAGIDQERVYDGWYLFGAVRHEAELGNIHPQFLNRIPYAPKGVADGSGVGPILGRGTGQTPRYQYQQMRSPWSVLQELAQDSGLPVGTSYSIPYYFGFDPFGNLIFEPVAFSTRPVVAGFSEYGAQVNAFPILRGLRVINSIADLRTEVCFQGLDAITNELIQVQQQTNTVTRRRVGERRVWLQRAARFASAEGLQGSADTGVFLASLPSLYVAFETVYVPWLHAADVVSVYESLTLGGAARFVVIALDGKTGLLPNGGQMVQEMSLLCRLQNDI